MRILFLGSGEFGLPTLRQLYADYDVAAVISQPDKPAGRRRQLTATPIAQWAMDEGIDVIKTANANSDDILQKVQSLKPDAAVVIAFGQKLGEPLIAALGGLVINLHASLLPKYRGAAPINWAIVNGEKYAGVSVIGLAQKMDAGVVYARAAAPVDPDETAGELHDRLALMGPDLISRVLDHFAHDQLQPETQDDTQATGAPKLCKADAFVDFSQSAEVVRNRIHGLNPWPGIKAAWVDAAGEVKLQLSLCRVKAIACDHNAAPGTIIENHHIACGQGAIEIVELQPPGKRPMSMQQFTNGRDVKVGDKLVSPPVDC